VAQKGYASMKTNDKEVEVHVTGPFGNFKLGKIHWVVMYGDNGQSLLLKSQFISVILNITIPSQEVKY
jgi:hypothetical protein